MCGNFMDFAKWFPTKLELSLCSTSSYEFPLSLLGSYNFNRYFISILMATTLPFIYIPANWWIKIAFICLHGIWAFTLILFRCHSFYFVSFTTLVNTVIRFYDFVICRFATYLKMDRCIFRNSMRPHFVKMYIGRFTNALHQMQVALSYRGIYQ